MLSQTACLYILFCLNWKREIPVENRNLRELDIYQRLKITLFMDKNDLH